ncbi:glyoxalase [Paenibacillus oralis]|uniref:Glyoxalase n=1 Tax=Paenibacillus oralis TaxID=2490856 RepID=A0A3P3U3M9_9BACL|nr:VOC family protein [Paenibacillus oralis]RRJ64158.1 glyoxalase [Paenibacillus oralis]
MKKIGHVTLLVKNYAEAIEFYTKKAGFVLLTDNAFGGGMRWVTAAPSQDAGTAIVFVEADTADKAAKVGSQAAGHVFLAVQTEDCYRDYKHMKANGVNFFGEPKEVPWGIEVVFEDLYGNRLDLVQHNGM